METYRVIYIQPNGSQRTWDYAGYTAQQFYFHLMTILMDTPGTGEDLPLYIHQVDENGCAITAPIEVIDWLAAHQPLVKAA